MKLLILVGLLTSVRSSENYGQGDIGNEERRVVGGGNYGGFIGLTTYPAGPFLVNGKLEREYKDFELNWQGYGEKGRSGYDGYSRYNDDRKGDSKKENEKNKNSGYEAKYRRNVGYEDIQKDQSYLDVQGYSGKTRNNNNLEYLGYRGPEGFCRGNDYRDEYGEQKYGDSDRSRSNRGKDSYYDEETEKRCDYLFGYTGPTANDEPENLIRPCALDDWQCIRKYFATHSKCKPAYGPIPDPLYIDINTLFFPVVNMTVALPNLAVRGLSGSKIKEFYVNKKSGNLVLVFEVMKFNETSQRAYFRYRRTAKESIVLADYFTIENSVTFTVVIPKIPHLRLDLADIHPFAENSTPPRIGPGAFDSKDPDVISAYLQFNKQAQTVVREALVYQSQLFASIYIQENICDFGLKIISV